MSLKNDAVVDTAILFTWIVSGQVSSDEAIVGDLVVIEGDLAAPGGFLSCCGLPGAH